ncbi:ComEC family competence protein [Patescibacteria group bacterium]|nr:ComEC family competence protein [Patescibacteria group bacterium]
MTKSKILLYFCLSSIGGIFLNSILFIPQLILLSLLILGILLISVFWKYKRLVVLGFCILFFVFGIWRHQGVLSKIENSPIKNFIGKEVTLIGLIEKEPDTREKSTKLTIKIEKTIAENSSPPDIGKVLVTAGKYPEYQYGDKIKIRGLLKAPAVFESFNYRDYLAKDGILAVIYFPEIELIAKNQGNFLQKSLISFKNKLKESLNKVMPEPQSAIFEALFFGDEGNISEDWKEKLNSTGTRHITAVSGMNITIISAILLNFLLVIGLWRSQAFYFSIILIILYILMIGAPSSVVRAGIMAGLLLIAQHFGRLSSASRAIVIAATIMLVQNPLLLRLDVGFQLSFLAIMGLIYLQPIFLDFFKKIPNFLQLRNNLAATLSAQLFTLPILIYSFGKIPITSPLSNILILPLIPQITVLGFIFSFFGIFWQKFAQVLSWPAWLLVTYILKIIDWFSKIPWTSLTLENVHWIFVLISYLILGYFAFRLNQKQKLKFLNY